MFSQTESSVVLSDDALVDKDTAAILTDDDLLVRADVQLVLGRNAVEAATTSFVEDADHGKTVTGILTDALVGHQ